MSQCLEWTADYFLETNDRVQFPGLGSPCHSLTKAVVTDSATALKKTIAFAIMPRCFTKELVFV